MSKEIYGRAYSPGDEVEIVELLTLIFNGWPHFDLVCSPVDHWRWKFLDNPLKKYVIGLAVVGNKIIGSNHSIYYKIKIGENTYLGHQGVDFGVHPNYRRRGATKKIGEAMKPQNEKFGSQIVYVLTNNEILIQNYKKTGMPAFPHQVIELNRIHDFGRHFKHVKAHPSSFIYNVGKMIQRKIRSLRGRLKPNIRNDFDIVQVIKFDERIDIFWDKVRENIKFVVERNMEFLNWRYCDPRGGIYRITMVIEENMIHGYCVTRINRYNEDYPMGIIVDLLTLPGRDDVIEALIDNAITYFNDEGVNVVKCWIIKGHPLAKIYDKFGFQITRRKLGVYYNLAVDEVIFGNDISIFVHSSPTEVHFQYGDVDTI